MIAILKLKRKICFKASFFYKAFIFLIFFTPSLWADQWLDELLSGDEARLNAFLNELPDGGQQLLFSWFLEQGEGFFSLAMSQQGSSWVKFLLEQLSPEDRTTYINYRFAHGENALHWAVLWGDLDLIQFLLDHAVAINQPDSVGQTPLHHAVRAFPERLDIIKLLLDHRADVRAIDTQGLSPLHGAARSGCWQSVELLLSHGACFWALDNDGHSPFFYAFTSRSVEAVSYFCYLFGVYAMQWADKTVEYYSVTRLCEGFSENQKKLSSMLNGLLEMRTLINQLVQGKTRIAFNAVVDILLRQQNIYWEGDLGNYLIQLFDTMIREVHQAIQDLEAAENKWIASLFTADAFDEDDAQPTMPANVTTPSVVNAQPPNAPVIQQPFPQRHGYFYPFIQSPF